jgi:hypothetical protein
MDFRSRAIVVFSAVLAMSGCSQEAAKSSGGSTPAKHEPSTPKVKFRIQEVADTQQGGLIALRYAVPQDWKTSGGLEWHYNDLYTPVQLHIRAEAPDASAWIESYPADLFYWLDPRWDNFKGGNGDTGGIHATNITLPDAMRRYVIQRYRGREKNLKILGSRPVKDLAKALGQPDIAGEGIDFRITYEAGGQPIDEEFFGLMTPKLTIPYHGPQGTTYEYHRSLVLVHSLGARRGKLEDARPVLGYIAHSAQVDKIWEQRRDVVFKQLQDAFQRNLAAGYARIEAAGRLSRAISANNDAMIQAMDQQRAAAASVRSANPSADASSAAEDFDQYTRGTEKVTDSSGEVSEQSSLYSYHWTDGFGNVVHSNDSSYDPNNYSNVPYEKMKPVK